MYLKEKKVIINELNVWFDKTTKEIKWLVVLYDKWTYKVFLNDGDEVRSFFWLESLPKTDEEMKELRRNLKENFESSKFYKYEILSPFQKDFSSLDTEQ